MEYRSDFDRYKDIVEEHLYDLIPDVDDKSITLYDAMKYSLSAGGKRLRPSLLLGACEFCGGDINDAIPFACAAEYIHTYSLIHDDLPAMDDDDLRRGKPTNHVIYGEAMAILAGDGLLSSAFEAINKDMLMYMDDDKALKKRIRAMFELAKGAGVRGMIAGQVADIENEGKSFSKEMLEYIDINKTGALIIGSLRAGAMLGKGDADMIKSLTEYGENLGFIYQITDDLLDIEGNAEEMGKAAGKDSQVQKATYPALYGADGARKKVEELSELAMGSIAQYYDNAEFFADVLEKVKNRTK